MSFDDLEFDYNDFSDEIEDDTMLMVHFDQESVDWHAKIFNFINPSNILYIPDQHYLV